MKSVIYPCTEIHDHKAEKIKKTKIQFHRETFGIYGTLNVTKWFLAVCLTSSDH